MASSTSPTRIPAACAGPFDETSSTLTPTPEPVSARVKPSVPWSLSIVAEETRSRKQRRVVDVAESSSWITWVAEVARCPSTESTKVPTSRPWRSARQSGSTAETIAPSPVGQSSHVMPIFVSPFRKTIWIMRARAGQWRAVRFLWSEARRACALVAMMVIGIGV